MSAHSSRIDVRGVATDVLNTFSMSANSSRIDVRGVTTDVRDTFGSTPPALGL